MYYREAKTARSCRKASTSRAACLAGSPRRRRYSTNNRAMMPFYIYYSMFGFQRIGDLAWAAGDMRRAASCSAAPPAAPRSTAKACSTRTATATSWPARSRTASATTRPSRYEVAVIMQDGLRACERAGGRLLLHHLMNENYAMPGLQAGTEEGSSRACTCFKDGGKPKKGEAARAPARLGHDPARSDRRGRTAGEGLRRDADIWSVPSFIELRRDGFDAERWNRLHPEAEQRVPYTSPAC
jgi:pyruvate dehydrogenase E1 component